MTQWYLIIDVARCSNCNNCTLASKDEHVGNTYPGYSAPQPAHGHEWITIKRRVRGEGHMVDAAYLPTMCNHCDNAPCIAATGGDIIRKRPDGIVIIDPDKAKGRSDIVDTCPYGAIWWNEEEQVPQHWFFDAHLIDQGAKEPRCAQVCPTDAIVAVKADRAEMLHRIEQEGLETLKPELQTAPRVYYRNLHRYTRDFIGGSVVADIDGEIECVPEAEVRLLKQEAIIAETKTDMFGDFKFDRITPEGQTYRVEANHPGIGRATTEVTVRESCHVGDLRLN